MVPSAGAPSNQQPAEQVTGNGAAAPADRLQSFRHVRTLSDDEEFLVAPAGITESEADTDELMGRVDWALAANSDEEHDVPPGWVSATVWQTWCALTAKSDKEHDVTLGWASC
jgi:hypothetical protein